MNIVDVIGSIGVSILLLAYFLNIQGKFGRDSLTYILLNIVGSAIACAASVLLEYYPFVILEGAWFLASCAALVKYFENNKSQIA